MSMTRCDECGRCADSDDFPEGFLVTKATLQLPAYKQDHVFVCEWCQQDMPEDELEQRTPK